MAELRRLTLAIVVAAAGYGTRLDSGLPKQYVPLLGVPMLQRTLMALSACPRVDALALVVHPQDVGYCSMEVDRRQIGKVVAVVPGGEKRAFSVRNGLRALAEIGAWDLVGVHDGARPLVTSAEIERAVAALEEDPRLDGVVLGVPAVDTIKLVDENHLIARTLDRSRLWHAQTPQIFRWRVLLDAYSASDDLLLQATDDAFLVESQGGRVAVVHGSPENIKVTDRFDLRRAERILAERLE
ncbi:MAG: 2-C-methyl-D-erythritol 4-phosphate cytidylyltransferase [Thermoleophilia bacterium]|nr:2-C-methyl-D-erythritol 4-phosphate cytidylyltransferase [Thermoleophilia bacterium]